MPAAGVAYPRPTESRSSVTFFQAEDGMRHGTVTGVQTCALPISKEMGRVTLNPLKHIDWFWTVLLPAMLFMSTAGRFMIGMAKPVPVNFARLHHPKRDMILVGLA